MANTSAQGLRQEIVRAVTGEAFTYNGDFLQLFDDLAVSADGGFNGRLLAYINLLLAPDPEFTSVPEAMAALAAANDATNFSAMNDFTPEPA